MTHVGKYMENFSDEAYKRVKRIAKKIAKIKIKNIIHYKYLKLIE